MAANKFATLLHRNTHRIAVILVYTLLEWILIVLLLLNGVFSYLISKFASFFGLKPSCVLCSRVDHLFEPDCGIGRRSYGHLFCDAHAAEFSLLGYCTHHRNLTDAGDMCEDCASSRPAGSGVLSWMKRSEMGEKDLRCSCCHVALESGFYSPFFPLKPSWDILECAQKGNPVAEVVGEEVEKVEDERTDDEGKQIDLVPRPEQEEQPLVDAMGLQVEKVLDEERLLPLDLIDTMTMMKTSATAQLSGQDALEIDHEGTLQDSWPLDIGVVSEEKKMVLNLDKEQADVVDDDSSSMPLNGEHIVECSAGHDILVPLVPQLGSEGSVNAHGHEILVPPVPQLVLEGSLDAQLGAPEAVEEFAGPQTTEEDDKLIDLDADCEVSIGSEISEQEQASQALSLEALSPPLDQDGRAEGSKEVSDNDQDAIIDLLTLASVDAKAEASQEFVGLPTSEEVKLEDVGANYQTSVPLDISEPDKIEHDSFHEHISLSLDADHFPDRFIDIADPVQAFAAEAMETILPSLDHLSPEHHEAEEERTPETPTHMEHIHGLHKRFMCERRESGTESLDGSVASEVEGCDPLTIDQLKSALTAERKALSALYAELEEERSAAAIATNQTMAMINRLQEEKSAMQMEALQYQRVMEEQSEYDQEALQLLNELVVKREKEKQDLEKELEVYRQRVLRFEAKERRRIVAGSKADGDNGSSSASSGAEDNDDRSSDYYDRDASVHDLNGSNQNTPRDSVLSPKTEHENAIHVAVLENSLVDFEEERLSILEELKALEDRLFALEDDEAKNHHGSNGNLVSSVDALRGKENGFSEDLDGRKLNHEGRSTGLKGKRLLPLFDAVGLENGDELSVKEEADENGGSVHSLSMVTKDQEKLAIAEEVAHVYERLQALEEDGEFFKHCIKSLKKGDKGLGLLQEILQNLRDLREVEMRARNAGDSPTSLPA